MGPLPDDSLVALTVADHDVGVEVLVVRLGTQGDPECSGVAETE